MSKRRRPTILGVRKSQIDMYWQRAGERWKKEKQRRQEREGSWGRQGEWHVNKSICFIDDILAEIFAKCHKVYDLSLLFDADCDGDCDSRWSHENIIIKAQIEGRGQRAGADNRLASSPQVYMQIFPCIFTPTKLSSAWHLEPAAAQPVLPGKRLWVPFFIYSRLFLCQPQI